MLALRIDERTFLALIRNRLKDRDTGYGRSRGPSRHRDSQGGIVSPVLANLYLHHALDLWFAPVIKPCCRGEAHLCRYADDLVCAFRFREDAALFLEVLTQRLAKFGLEVASEKTQVLRSPASILACSNGRVSWGSSCIGSQTRDGRRGFSAALPAGRCTGRKDWIKTHRHLPGRAFIEGLIQRLRVDYNYYGLRGNSRDLWRFYQRAIECAFKWLNRRGGKRKSSTSSVFHRTLRKLGIAKPRITEQPFARVVFP